MKSFIKFIQEEDNLDEANQVKMSALKPGDTVKLNKRFGGKQGTVKEVHPNGATVHVSGSETPVFTHHSNFTKLNVQKEEVELDEGLFGGGKKIEDHHYTLINTDVNKRVGHGTVWKSEAGAKNYHKGRGPSWHGDHMKVMTVGDAKKRGVPEHNFHNLAVSEEIEQINEISKKLAKSYLDKSAAERKANSVYSTREKFRGRMIGGATADAKLKGRVEEPYKFGQAPKRKMRVKVAATNEEVDINDTNKHLESKKT